MTRCVAVALALGFLIPRANAAFVVYTDRNLFLSVLNPGFLTEDFEGVTQGLLSSPQSFPQPPSGTFSFEVAAPSGLFSDTISGDRFLGVSDSVDILSISGFTGNPTAVGAYFFFDNGSGGIDATGTGSLLVSNGVDPNLIVNIDAPTSPTTFFGFVSTSGPITGIVFTNTSSMINGFSDIDDVIVGEASEVPEPGTFSMLLLGLGVAGLQTRRWATRAATPPSDPP